MPDAAKKEISKLQTAFVKRVKTIVSEVLAPLGFALAPKSRQRWERTTKTTRQRCRFAFESGGDDVDFKVYCSRSFRFTREIWANAPRDAATQETLARFFTALSKNADLVQVDDLEYITSQEYAVCRLDFHPNTEDDLEELLPKIQSALQNEAVPFFERRRELSDLLNAYDAGVEDLVYDFEAAAFADLYLANARFQVGQYAEAAAHLDVGAEKTLANDSFKASSEYWRLYAKALQIGALSVKKTVEEKGAGSRPPKPKRRWRELEIPETLSRYPNRNAVYRFLEKAASPFVSVATKAFKELEKLAEEEKTRSTSEEEFAAQNEARDKATQSAWVRFSGAPEAQEILARMKKELKERVRQLLVETLAPQGFKKASRDGTAWTRETRTFEHYCRFSFLLEGRGCSLDYGVALRPDFSLFDAAPQDVATRGIIANFLDYTNKYWSGLLGFEGACQPQIPTDREELASVLNDFTATLNDALRLFERYRDAADFLRDYEAGRAPYHFGEDFWGNLKVAILRFQVGQFAEAETYLREARERALEEFQPPNEFTSTLPEVAQIGVLSLQNTIAKKGPGSTPPQPKRLRSERPIPEALALCVEPSEVRLFLERAESPNEAKAQGAREILARWSETSRRLPKICSQTFERQGFTQDAENPCLWLRETATLVSRRRLVLPEGVLRCSYGFKLDFSPWARVPNDAESQETLRRLKEVVAKRIQSLDLRSETFNPNERRDELESGSFAERFDAVVNAINAKFTDATFLSFERWNESSDLLTAYEAGEISENYFGNDVATQNFVRALFLFQAGRYDESAKRFDSLAKSKRRPESPAPPDDEATYFALRRRLRVLRLDNADWATLQAGARLAVASIRQIAKNQ